MKLDYKPHEFADIFPMMQPHEFVDLKADIKEKGLLENIVMYDGKILDGRNRFKACQEVGVEILTNEYAGEDPLGFVISLNLKRRHLTTGQRAMVAASLADMPSHRPKNKGANLHPSNVSAEKAGQILNVSERSVKTAKKVQQNATPELIEKVQQGNIAVSVAADVAELPKPEQAEIVAKGEKQILQAAKEIRANKKNNVHVSNNSGENEWYTPNQYIESARIAMGSIDLDPASCEKANENVKADSYFSKENCGLKADWKGNVWMNPPYSQPLMNDFVLKLLSELGRINQAIVLVNNATETKWFQMLAKASDAICLPKSRIKYLDKNNKQANSPLQGQAFIYIGNNKQNFINQFCAHGVVLVNANK